MGDEIRLSQFWGLVCFGLLAWIGLLLTPKWWGMMLGAWKGSAEDDGEVRLDPIQRASAFSIGAAGLASWLAVLHIAWACFWGGIS
jgi:hypothetical protein